MTIIPGFHEPTRLGEGVGLVRDGVSKRKRKEKLGGDGDMGFLGGEKDERVGHVLDPFSPLFLKFFFYDSLSNKYISRLASNERQGFFYPKSFQVSFLLFHALLTVQPSISKKKKKKYMQAKPPPPAHLQTPPLTHAR